MNACVDQQICVERMRELLHVHVCACAYAHVRVRVYVVVFVHLYARAYLYVYTHTGARRAAATTETSRLFTLLNEKASAWLHTLARLRTCLHGLDQCVASRDHSHKCRPPRQDASLV